jgi:hypothetical protein
MATTYVSFLYIINVLLTLLILNSIVLLQVEYPIPEQFKTTYNGKGLTTIISEIAWINETW